MQDPRLQSELTEAKAEIVRLRERLSLGTPTVHKDLSLISLVPKWSGSEAAVPLEEFINSIEAAARIGRWQDRDNFEIAVLKLTDSAKLFYQGSDELHARDATWQTFKDIFRRRYKDVHTDQHHYLKLQTARQGKNETPQEFLDRCRALARKITCKVDDPLAQRVHQENAERMLLASFVAGLTGVPGRQVRYANPQTVQHALQVALSVQEAEKQERFNNSFYTRFENSVSIRSRPSSRNQSESEGSRNSGAARASNNTSVQRSSVSSRATAQGTRNARTRAALRCYECEGIGHFGRECPTRLRREEGKGRSSERRGQTERSSRSGSPTKKPPF